MRVLLAVGMMVGLVVAARGQEADLTAAGAEIKGEFTVARAMEEVYGHYDAENKSSTWTPRPGPAFDKRWPDSVRVRVLKTAPYVDDGVTRQMLVTWAKPEEGGAEEHSCHACGVLLGILVFRKSGEAWKVESSNLQVATVGAWGKPPEMKVQRLGTHAWGVVLQQGDMHQAQVEKALWIYGPKAGSFGEWFKAELIDDGANGEFPDDDWCKAKASELQVMCVWRQVDYTLDPSAGKDVYDLVKTRRLQAAPGWKKAVFRFDGNAYVKVGAPPAKP